MYRAPEAFEAGAKINLSVDVYSFGIFLWELITGRSYLDYVPQR
jgi:serine/threonine protein kinase